MSITANRPHPKRGRSLTQYLRIPPEKMPQSCRIAYVNEAIVDRQDGSRRVFSLDIPEGVAVRHNEEGLVWWALSLKVQSQYGPSAFNSRRLKINKIVDANRMGYAVEHS